MEQGQPSPATPDRRGFFRWLTYALGAVAALLVGVPYLGYLLGVRKRPVEWQDLGPLSKFPQGQTRLATFDNKLRQPWDGITAHTGVYVRYLGEKGGRHEFLVLAMNCAHLGCGVEWFPQSGLFMCPCHGGVYYQDGERASGPPPRGLYHCPYRLTQMGDGLHLEVQSPHYPTLHDTLEHPA